MINIITGTKGANKGKTIQVSKDPKIGFVTVQSETDVLRNGWFDTKKLTTNVRGPIEKLQNSSDKSQGLKLAGETGVVCMKDGSPIYRQTEFTKEPSAHNVYIQHTNIDEIRKANGIETKAVALEDYVKQQA